MSPSTSRIERNNTRRVLAFTGNRADYAPMLPVLRELERADDVDLSVVVSGSHLAPLVDPKGAQVTPDGFKIAAEVEALVASNTPVGTLKSLSLVVVGVADVLNRMRPDLLIVLGDRYETFAAATAGALSNVPIAHIAGGDVTQGAIDDSLRHAITKLSHLHFPAYESHARRIRQMGEAPEHVHVVGNLSSHAVREVDFLSRRAILRELGLRDSRPLIVVTYHPVTIGSHRTEDGIRPLLTVLEDYSQGSVAFTAPNPDPGSQTILAEIEGYVRGHTHNARLYSALGPVRYASLVYHADLVVGNSSSGLHEAPVLGTPTVNIGVRQQGRARPESVIDCAANAASIANAVRLGLSTQCRSRAILYSTQADGDPAVRIADVVRSAEVYSILDKKFWQCCQH